MIDNEKIKSAIEHFRAQGENVRVRDIAYALLSEMFADPRTAYQCLFGGDTDGYDEYSNDPMRDRLRRYLAVSGLMRTVGTDDFGDGITFEENKREMEALLQRTQEAMDDGLVDPKDGLKLIADIRVKLNDKFKVERLQKERQIIVEKRFDFVCPHTRRECYQLDKEEAMRRWNLIENEKQ